MTSHLFSFVHQSNSIRVPNFYVKLGECMDKPTVGRYTLKDKNVKDFVDVYRYV